MTLLLPWHLHVWSPKLGTIAMRSTSYIVFDHYRKDRIKNSARRRRGKSKEMVILDNISLTQKVPVVLENFWPSSNSKTAFQVFYVEWLTSNYQDSKLLYLGISPLAWLVSAAWVCFASPYSQLQTRGKMMTGWCSMYKPHHQITLRLRNTVLSKSWASVVHTGNLIYLLHCRCNR